MKREEFEDQVEAQAPPDLRGSDHLAAAIYGFGRRGGPFYHPDVRAAVDEAGRRREQAPRPAEEAAPRRSPRPKPGAEALFVSERLVEDLKPWTEGLRQEGEFRSTGPPYPDDESAAADYIERTSAADRARWNESRRGREADHERIEQLARQLGLDVTTKKRFLVYGRPGDDHQKNAPVVPGTFLFKLAGEVNRVSRNTGLPPDALTAHVFTGITPLMSRVRITDHEKHVRLPSGEQGHFRSVTLTFHTADLTFEELRTIYDQIKGHMGGSGVQALTQEDFELRQLVKEMGGPPEPYSGVRAFWLEVLGRWNENHPDAYTTWEGVKSRYSRIMKRLQPPGDA